MFKDLNLAVRAFTMYYGRSVVIIAEPSEECVVVKVTVFMQNQDGDTIQVVVSTPLLKERDVDRDVEAWIESVTAQLDAEIEKALKPTTKLTTH